MLKLWSREWNFLAALDRMISNEKENKDLNQSDHFYLDYIVISRHVRNSCEETDEEDENLQLNLLPLLKQNNESVPNKVNAVDRLIKTSSVVNCTY